MLEEAGPVMEWALRENFGYSLVLCGHSMGGSVAALATLELLFGAKQSILPPGITARCVAVGPAPVFRGPALDPAARDRVTIYTQVTSYWA